MALAIFDLDNTLLAGDSDHAWGEYLVEKGLVDANAYKTANDQFLADYQSGNLDINTYLEFALAPLSQHTIKDLNSYREEFFEQKIRPIMLSKAFDLLALHKSRGDYLLIITATNRFVTEIIADAFGVDDLIATEPEIVNGSYTGKVKGTPSFREGKITRLKQWLEGKQYDLAGSFFYSDSHNDAPLLKLVDNPIAIDPDEALQRICDEYNWPSRSLRD